MTFFTRALTIGLALIMLSLCISNRVDAQTACEGQFRPGFECSNATDGDWTTSAVPDAYNDSIAVIEEFQIPAGVIGARWRFKTLRNNLAIEVRASYWDYCSASWVDFYIVPFDLAYMTYSEEIPVAALSISPLRIRTHVRNAAAQSGMYFEGVVDWIGEPYSCVGVFRSGHECAMAVDADTLTSAVPDAYGDSIEVYEEYAIPSDLSSANWIIRVLRNTTQIAIRASYWNHVLSDWQELFSAPLDADWQTYVLNVPAEALNGPALKTKVLVRNASFPLQSGEYMEGMVDWVRGCPSPIYPVACPYFAEDVNCDGVVNVLDVVTTVNVSFRGTPKNPPCCPILEVTTVP